MFFLDCGELQIVGASPETLCKVEKNKVYNHAIAGTTKRGKSPEGGVSVFVCTFSLLNRINLEDEILGAALQASEKDRAEHIMLVDLARNDVNRICQPQTVKVDQLMELEKFSHVIHMTSQVSGILREGMTRYLSIFHLFAQETDAVWALDSTLSVPYFQLGLFRGLLRLKPLRLYLR